MGQRSHPVTQWAESHCLVAHLLALSLRLGHWSSVLLSTPRQCMTFLVYVLDWVCISRDPTIWVDTCESSVSGHIAEKDGAFLGYQSSHRHNSFTITLKCVSAKMCLADRVGEETIVCSFYSRLFWVVALSHPTIYSRHSTLAKWKPTDSLGIVFDLSHTYPLLKPFVEAVCLLTVSQVLHIQNLHDSKEFQS